jgi:putative lipoprotein
MKAPRAFAAAIGLFGAGCATLDRPGDDWWGRDKAHHFAASAALGAGTSYAARNQERGRAESAAMGFAVAMTFGAAKETYDARVKRTGWSWKDFIWDAAGATVGSAAAAQMR